MSSSLDCLDLCRLCLIKDRVSVPIFEDEGDVRQIFLKITACLPVKVSRDDKLPKKICDDCVYKVELFYQFWNTTANAEKQLLQWLGEVDLEDKQTYVTEVLDTNVMKQEQNSDNRLEGNVIQVSGHQNNMDIGMIEDMTIMTIPAGSEQQFTTVPMDTSGTVQTVQAVPGPSTHDQMGQSQTHLVTEEVEESEEEENSDDGCDNEEGLPVKEETEEVQTETFVNVPISCDEAGPSGLQQQKVTEMSEMSMTQTATDGDPKTGMARARRFCRSIYARNHSPPQTILTNNLPIKTEVIYLQVKSFATVKNDKDDLKCKFCQKTFKSEIGLKNHVRNTCPFEGVSEKKKKIKASENGVVCQFCGNTFKSQVTLKCHIKNIHNKKKKIYKCDHCDFKTTWSDSIKKHAERHSNTPETNIQCDLCDMILPTSAKLKTHRMKHEPTVDPLNPKAEPTYKCDNCSMRFKTKHFLSKHRRYHNNNLIKCKICGKLYQDKEEYDIHVETRHNFECDICKEVFNRRGNLLKHLAIHDKLYVCHICGHKLSDSRSLNIHVRSHNNDFQFYCDHCDKGFMYKGSLRCHVVVHSNDRPYSCDICQSTFRSYENYKKHKQIHNVNRKRHQCQLCDNFFYSKKSFRLHMMRHDGVRFESPCDICGKVLTKSSMHEHMRRHTGEKPHACDNCGKRFVSKKGLNKHKVVHSNNKNYVCASCGKAFNRKDNLQVHERSHEKNKLDAESN